MKRKFLPGILLISLLFLNACNTPGEKSSDANAAQQELLSNVITADVQAAFVITSYSIHYTKLYDWQHIPRA